MIYWIRKEVSFRKMEKLTKIAQYTKAHLVLDDLLTYRASDPDVLMQKAWIYLEENKFDLVLSLVQSVPHYAADPVFLMLEGEAFYHLGLFEEAKRALLASIALSPDNLRTEYTLALVYVAQKDFVQAAKWFENSVKYDKHLVQSKVLTMAEHYLHSQKFGNV